MVMMRILFEATELPVLQNRVYATAEEARNCATGDIRLQQDPATGIVSNVAFDPSRIVYDRQYDNEQAHSTRFQAHLDAVAAHVEAMMGRTELVEVGCGKGHFLEMLCARGMDVSGFDPAYDGTNPRVLPVAFGADLRLRGKGLILRHVLEHIPSPLDFLSKLAIANGGQGLIYIEVPCLDWIASNLAWFDIFYEHVNYFRLSDFHRIFGRVLNASHCFGGQYLSVVADLASLRYPVQETGMPYSLPLNFNAMRRPGARPTGAPSVVWGAASKGVVFSIACARAGVPIDRVIDINPNKQGRYLPITGLRVDTPEAGLRDLPVGTNIFVMNPNYLEEIRAQAGDNYHYRGANDV
jgi:hypothetical protein